MRDPRYRVGQRLTVNDSYRGSQIVSAEVKEIRELNEEWVYLFKSTFKPTYESDLSPL
jgi:hypothetical protein